MQLRRAALVAAALIALVVPVAAAPIAAAGGDRGNGHGSGPGARPGQDIIQLPVGFRPEGIAVRGDTFWVGSLADGAIYRGDLRTGKGSILVPGATGRIAVGTEIDDRGRLWVAGGTTGTGRVYDASSGALLMEFTFPGSNEFVNDVTVTRSGAYFTDSNHAVLYGVTLGRRGVIGAVTTLALTGDFVLDPASFNLNGIESSRDGRTLIAVQSGKGLLFAIDPASGVTRQIDLGRVVLKNGDGLLRDGRTLYVVQNQDNQIAVLSLNRAFTAGTLTGTLTDPAYNGTPSFKVPTTIGKWRNSLFAVNAKFGVASPETQPYEVVKVPLSK